MQLPKRVSRRRALRSDLVALDFGLDGKLRGTDNAGSAVDIFPAPPESIPLSQKGAALGVAPLGLDQKIASIYLPGSVDDIQPYPNFASLPATGEVAIIYVAVNDGLLHPSNPTKEYRWNGSGYTELLKSPGTTDALVEGAVNQYFTVARAIAALTPTLASYLTITAANTALTANSAADRNRENHTGQQAPSTIAGFNAAVLAAIEASNASLGEAAFSTLYASYPPAANLGKLLNVAGIGNNTAGLILRSNGTRWVPAFGPAFIFLSNAAFIESSAASGVRTVFTVSIPGGLVGPTGSVVIRPFIDFDTGTTNSMRIRMGPNISGSIIKPTPGNILSFQPLVEVWGNGSLSAQRSGSSGNNNSGSGTSSSLPPAAYAIDTSINWTIEFEADTGATAVIAAIRKLRISWEEI